MTKNLKITNEITTLLGDYTTTENVQLYKGQHVQIIQRLNNDYCLVQLLNHPSGSNEANNSTQKQPLEVQIPSNLIKIRTKFILADGIMEHFFFL